MSAADVFASGSVALITGGASGIGLAIAKLCRSKGMRLLLVDRNAADLEKAKSSILGEKATDHDVVTSLSDVSQLENWTALKETAIATFGSVELLVLNAGTGGKGSWGNHDYFNTVSPATCTSSLTPTPLTHTRRSYKQTSLE